MTALALRTCSRNAQGQLESCNGFIWPESGEVICPDWKPTKECGNGLHGCLWGEGDGLLLSWGNDAVWLVVEISDWIDLGGKVKFEKANVVFCGNQFDATNYIIEHGAQGKAVIGATLTGGVRATLTGGYRATLTGGYGATLTGGNRATLTGGYGATLTGGDMATLTGGCWATLTGGDGATLTGGVGATLTAKIWDGDYYRIYTAYVGEDGILPNIPYQFDTDSKTFKPIQS